MQKYLLLLFISFTAANNLFAQADVFGSEQSPKRNGFILGVNANFDIPGADMAKRFGLSYRVGPSVLYKTKSNWLFGAKCDWISGNKMKDDSLMWNIKDRDGNFLTNQGDRQGVGTFERGYTIGLMAGRIIPVFKNNLNSGVTLLTTVGFMQYKINIFDKDGVIPALNKTYKKGYDRLTNGMFIEQFIGYTYFDKENFFNFHLGFDILAGFTKGRRDYQYDLMRKDDKNRLDLLFGLRGGWYIPLFKKKSEEVYFD